MRAKREAIKPKPTLPSSEDKALSQAELCRRYQVDAKHLSRAAKTRGLTPQQYLEQKTGWTHRDRKFYPPTL